MPRPHRLLASGLAAAFFLATAWLVPGCGSEPTFDASVDYTPESLAKELVFRANDLSPAARKASKKRSGPAAGAKAAPGFVPEPETKGQSKSQTKKAEVQTLDDVLDDIEQKAARIRSLPTAEVFKQMAGVVSRDTTLEPKDRDTLVEKLNEMAAAPASAPAPKK